MSRIMGWLFGCTHSNLSRVFTIKRRTYKVCMSCGKEFNYSLAEMRVIPDSSTRQCRAERAVA